MRLQIRVATAAAVEEALIEPLLAAQTGSDEARFAWDDDHGRLDLQACARCCGEPHQLAGVVGPLFRDAEQVVSNAQLLEKLRKHARCLAEPISAWA